MSIRRISKELAGSDQLRDRLIARALLGLVRLRGGDIDESTIGGPGAQQQLLTLGDLSSRYLVVRSPATEVFRKSVEQIGQEVTNRRELDDLVRAIAQPYEQLFITQAQTQPRGRGVGGWEYADVTKAGKLRYAAWFSYHHTKKFTGIESATVEVISDFDPPDRERFGRKKSPTLTLSFDNNQIQALNLSWEQKQPSVLLDSQKNKPLGNFIHEITDVRKDPKRRTKSSVEIVLGGEAPYIKSSADVEWRKEAGSYHYQELTSSFDYQADANVFKRHMDNPAHHKGAGVDSLTSLTPGEFALIVNGMLELFPSTDLQPIFNGSSH